VVITCFWFPCSWTIVCREILWITVSIIKCISDIFCSCSHNKASIPRTYCLERATSDQQKDFVTMNDHLVIIGIIHEFSTGLAINSSIDVNVYFKGMNDNENYHSHIWANVKAEHMCCAYFSVADKMNVWFRIRWMYHSPNLRQRKNISVYIHRDLLIFLHNDRQDFEDLSRYRNSTSIISSNICHRLQWAKRENLFIPLSHVDIWKVYNGGIKSMQAEQVRSTSVTLWTIANAQNQGNREFQLVSAFNVRILRLQSSYCGNEKYPSGYDMSATEMMTSKSELPEENPSTVSHNARDYLPDKLKNSYTTLRYLEMRISLNHIWCLYEIIHMTIKAWIHPSSRARSVEILRYDRGEC
jgi:hypothetical protein